MVHLKPAFWLSTMLWVRIQAFAQCSRNSNVDDAHKNVATSASLSNLNRRQQQRLDQQP